MITNFSLRCQHPFRAYHRCALYCSADCDRSQRNPGCCACFRRQNSFPVVSSDWCTICSRRVLKVYPKAFIYTTVCARKALPGSHLLTHQHGSFADGAKNKSNPRYGLIYRLTWSADIVLLHLQLLLFKYAHLAFVTPFVLRCHGGEFWIGSRGLLHQSGFFSPLIRSARVAYITTDLRSTAVSKYIGGHRIGWGMSSMAHVTTFVLCSRVRLPVRHSLGCRLCDVNHQHFKNRPS